MKELLALGEGVESEIDALGDAHVHSFELVVEVDGDVASPDGFVVLQSIEVIEEIDGEEAAGDGGDVFPFVVASVVLGLGVGLSFRFGGGVDHSPPHLDPFRFDRFREAGIDRAQGFDPPRREGEIDGARAGGGRGVARIGSRFQQIDVPSPLREHRRRERAYESGPDHGDGAILR